MPPRDSVFSSSLLASLLWLWVDRIASSFSIRTPSTHHTYGTSTGRYRNVPSCTLGSLVDGYKFWPGKIEFILKRFNYYPAWDYINVALCFSSFLLLLLSPFRNSVHSVWGGHTSRGCRGQHPCRGGRRTQEKCTEERIV